MPVGHIIESTNENFDPNTLYIGTTWEKIEGRFTLGSSGAYSLGSTGGEAEHVLTVNEMPIHSHAIQSVYQWTSSNPIGYLGTGGARLIYSEISTKNAGGNGPHNNMPPYIVVNKWVRTA